MASPLIEHIDFYFNQEGLMVLTEKYHLERGFCCGNGCLHCPYDYEWVSEPLKTRLREERKEKLSFKRADKNPET